MHKEEQAVADKFLNGNLGVFINGEFVQGEGEELALINPVDGSQLGKLIDSPGFTTLSPQWQGYLQAQRALGRPSIPLNDIGQAISRGEDIGIAVPDVIRARFEARAKVPYSVRSQAWLRDHWLRMGALHFIGTAIAWSLLLLVIAGIGLTTLGYHVRGRARVINSLLQQLQASPAQAGAQP